MLTKRLTMFNSPIGCPFSDVAEAVAGATRLKPGEHRLPIVHVRDLRSVDDSAHRLRSIDIDRTSLPSLSNRIVKRGDIVMTALGSVLNAVVAPTPMRSSQ